MANEILQEGFGQIAVQDVQNSTINITQQLGKSVQYQDLREQLDTQSKLLAYIPETDIEMRLSVSKKITDLEDRIEQLKHDVVNLANEFNRIEINTERLRLAKELFDNGDFDKCRLILEANIEEIKSNQIQLLERRVEYEENILPKLKHSADEFLVLALSKKFDYDNPNRFSEINECFENSIESFPTKDNLYLYAAFLQEQNQFSKSEEIYGRLIQHFWEKFSLVEQATILNNVAVLFKDGNSYENAKELYEKALEIYRELVNKDAQLYLPYLGNTLNNLGLLYNDQKDYEKAWIYYEEALNIRRRLVSINPETYSPNLAKTLNNIGLLYDNKKEFSEAFVNYEEALKIYRELAEKNVAYLDEVAKVLYNLSILHQEKSEEALARSAFDESLSIYRELAKQNPDKYLPLVATALGSSAVLNNGGNEEQYFENLSESLQIRETLAKANPYAYQRVIAQTLDNLSILNSKREDYETALMQSNKALEIYRKLSEGNPNIYLSEIAATLNDLSNLHLHKDDAETVLRLLEEALQIRLKLFKENPHIYQEDLAQTIYTLAVFYQESKPERNKSVEYAKDVIKILLPMADESPRLNRYLQNTYNILLRWGFSQEEIQELNDSKSENPKILQS